MYKNPLRHKVLDETKIYLIKQKKFKRNDRGWKIDIYFTIDSACEADLNQFLKLSCPEDVHQVFFYNPFLRLFCFTEYVTNSPTTKGILEELKQFKKNIFYGRYTQESILYNCLMALQSFRD